MITPLFDLDQDKNSVIVKIRAPFAKISSTEIFAEGHEFLFSSKPYFLRLYLPKEVKDSENDENSATYDSDSGVFMVPLTKKNVGEFFPGLELTTKLLTPSGSSSARKLVEELDNGPEEDASTPCEISLPSTSGLSMDQTIISDSAGHENVSYGFGNLRIGVFSNLREELSELIDIDDPDHKTWEERAKFAYEQEKSQFSDEHYLADLFNCDEIKQLIAFICFWDKNDHQFADKFTDDEKDRLKNLPRKLLPKIIFNENSILFSLVDILFAFAFNFRTTEGENNSESGWLITKISPTLSCLMKFGSYKEALVCIIRRSLCFPLYRNWDLTMTVLKDVKRLCKLGRNAILKCFLEVHKIFANAGDYRYIFNDLYITDYCLWLQYAEDDVFGKLFDEINSVKIEKSEISLDLDELELCGLLALTENEAVSGTENNIDKIDPKNLSLQKSTGFPVDEDSDDFESSPSESDVETSKNEEIDRKLNLLKLS